MSINNIKDIPTRNALREIKDQLTRVEALLYRVTEGGNLRIYHSNILEIGTNTHAQIDTHIANASIHFTEASIDHDNILNEDDESHVHVATSAPAAPTKGQLWSDTTGGSIVLYVYDGSDWMYVIGNA